MADFGTEELTRLAEQTIKSDLIYQGKVLLEVRRDQVRLPDGKETVREYVKHSGAVVIIPVLDNGDLIFEKQYRYPVQRIMLELPAGKIDSGEAVLNTAMRELYEETGYIATEWRHLGRMHPCVGYSNERIEIFLAQGLQQESTQHPDQGEFIELLTLSLEEAINRVKIGQITDGKTIVALFWAEKILRPMSS